MANSGEWLITVVDASVLKGFDLFCKSDLYVKVKIGDKIYKTKTCKNQNNPIWNESFSIPMNNMSDLELEVMDDDIFKDDKVGIINIYRDQFPNTFGEEKEYSIPLCHKNKDIGILHIRIKNNNVGNMNQNASSYSGQETLRNENNVSNLNDVNRKSNIGAMGAAIIDYQIEKNDNAGTLRDEDYKDRMPTVDNNAMNSNYNTTPLPSNTLHSGNNADLVGTSEIIHQDHLTEKDKKKNKKDKKHKHKHNHDEHHRKVILPEKHHHYEDGYSTSTSESSNEGERRRAAEGKLGTHQPTSTTKTTPNDYNTNTNTNANTTNTNNNNNSNN